MGMHILDHDVVIIHLTMYVFSDDTEYSKYLLEPDTQIPKPTIFPYVSI